MIISKKLLVFIFIIFVSSAYIYLLQDKNKNISEHLESKTQQYQKNYNILYNKYKALARIVFETKIDTQEIKSIFEKAYKGTDEEKVKIRAELLSSLQDTYDILKLYNIRQLHFHLPDNESFLRFHKPKKFGDNLTGVRATVEYVNQTQKPIDGFEEGKIYNGYRFVSPLFYEDQHIGSVEISFSTLSMNIEMMANYDVVGKFLISKEMVDTKVFNSEKSNYAPSRFQDFYYEKQIEKALEKYNKDKFDLSISQETKDIIHQTRHDKNSFSLYDKQSDAVMTFLKVVNPISNHVVGLFVLRSDANYIHIQKEIFIKALLSSSIVLALLLALLYRMIHEKNKLFEEVHKKTEQLNRSKKEMEDYIKIIDRNIISSSTDLDGNITYASKAFCDVSGYTKEELLGQNHSIIRHPSELTKKYEKMWESLRENKIWKGELKNQKKNGEAYWVDATISPLFLNGKKVGYTAIRQDITDKKLIERISQTDRLTQVYNRVKLDEALLEEIERNKRYDTDFSIILLDIDKFKSINDTYGHLVGDEVLISVTNILASNIRKTDIIGRWGGEEFLIICKNTDHKGAGKIAENLRFQIEKNNFKTVGDITASFGVTQYQNKEDEEEMLQRADQALYFCKNNGRNQVKIQLSR